MERLAYEAHISRGDAGEVADLLRGTALTILEQSIYLGDAGLAAEFLDYVDQRAGLLLGRGGAPESEPSAADAPPVIYSFPHRTFQEYLAGCYLVSQRDRVRVFFSHAEDDDAWGLAAQLGAEELLYNRRNLNGLLDLAYRLCPAAEAYTTQAWRALMWAGRMAALAGREAIEVDTDSPDGGAVYLQRLIPRLVELFASDLSPSERAEAGIALAKLGDPRTEALSAAELALCDIPAGPFLMGSMDQDEMLWDDEKPQHEQTTAAYRMGKYPVTNAQYAEFAAAGGYGEGRYWTEAEAAGYWKEGAFKGRFDETPQTGPREYGEPFNLPNHPMVGVSWYEALAFTRWLTEVWRAAGRIGPGESVRLPTEAEWEKAARGAAGRVYPWGDEPDSERANYNKTGIGATSTVGCFPGGASPYGMLDMSGNVDEWCATKWQGSYEDYRGDNDLSGDHTRVVRGGSCNDGRWFVRCAFRYRYDPVNRYVSVGFRVCASPDLL